MYLGTVVQQGHDYLEANFLHLLPTPGVFFPQMFVRHLQLDLEPRPRCIATCLLSSLVLLVRLCREQHRLRRDQYSVPRARPRRPLSKHRHLIRGGRCTSPSPFSPSGFPSAQAWLVV